HGAEYFGGSVAIRNIYDDLNLIDQQLETQIAAKPKHKARYLAQHRRAERGLAERIAALALPGVRWV
ncbi:MAG: hypothetical protein KGI71_05570, partial [Patescibacteria group bacterium]|nr:hypothetical protein [Patescibacteria group bacterium]